MLTQQNLSTIAEGMEVYDRDGARVGTIRAFRHGAGAHRAIEADIITMANAVSETLGGQRDLPTILYSRMYEEGFLCVDRGFLRKDAIVFMRDIGDVTANAVFLNVENHELVKI